MGIMVQHRIAIGFVGDAIQFFLGISMCSVKADFAEPPGFPWLRNAILASTLCTTMRVIIRHCKCLSKTKMLQHLSPYGYSRKKKHVTVGVCSCWYSWWHMCMCLHVCMCPCVMHLYMITSTDNMWMRLRSTAQNVFMFPLLAMVSASYSCTCAAPAHSRSARTSTSI